jgi:prolyl oligopeptidase
VAASTNWFAQLSFVLVTAALLWSAQQAPPTARKQPVTDTYHGVAVTDNYRYLEDWSNPETKAWSNAQNTYARAYLNALPGRASLRDQIARLLSAPSPNYFALREQGGKLFALQFQPPQEQPVLVTLGAPDPVSARIIVDPVQLDRSGHTAMDFYAPSNDGKYVAVSLSKTGSESGDVHIFETGSGRALPDITLRVNGGTAGGSLAWNRDGSGYYYTRYPREGERPPSDLGFYQQVWFHRLGTESAADTYSLGKDFPRIAEISLKPSRDGRFILATMSNGDGGEHAHYLLGPDGQWLQITRLSDDVISGTFGEDGFLYMISRQGAPKMKVLRLPVERPVLSRSKTVVPESDLAIESVVASRDRLYVTGTLGGPSEIRIFTLDGDGIGKVPLPVNSAVYQALNYHGQLMFQSASYVTPPAWYSYDGHSDKVTVTALRSTSPANFSDVEVRREYAVSKDGTKVPVNILFRKGTRLDGNNPALLTGYGGYNISLPPFFDPASKPLLDRGVVLAVANLRGGGEYGEEWHRAGNLTRKQNVFDDFEACARHLIAAGYTKPSRLAIEGGSNGGLLMGAALTQHPELFTAVVSHVGIYDMLRVELSPNGAFNVTEFGTVKEPEQFRALYAYSPYHHVADGKEYPAILFMTGENDPRVDPMHSRKMIARLQASGTKKPVLLRTSATAGHGIGTSLSEQIEDLADAYAFLFAQWHVKP